MPTMTMDQLRESINQSVESEENLIDILPAELLEIVLLNVYCDGDICNGYQSIYDALDCIKQKLPSISKNMRLVCKIFNFVNDSIGKKSSSKNMLKKFYRSSLIKNWPDYKDLKYTELEEFLKTGNDNGIISKITYEYLFYSKLYGSLVENFNRIITMLLFYGANVNSKDNNGSTAMHQALERYYGKEDLVKEIIIVLLAHGADVNLQDENGNTVLHDAVCTYDPGAGRKVLEIIKILLDHRADLNITNNAGNTPLTFAERGQFYDLKQFLRSVDKKVEEKPKTCILI